MTIRTLALLACESIRIIPKPRVTLDMTPSAFSLPFYAGVCGSTLTVVGTLLFNLTAPSRNFHFAYCATPGHEDSLAFTLLNPNKCPTEQDKFSLSILRRDLRAGISDEEVLARFTKGFFGGWIFTPERWFFSLTHFTLMDYDGKKLACPACTFLLPFRIEIFHNPESRTDIWYHHLALSGVASVNLTNKVTTRNGLSMPVNKNQIWTTAALSRTMPPPLGTLLFGNFLVFESSAASQQQREALFPAAKQVPRPEFVFAEYVGGPSKTFGLLPSHRFEVTREKEGEADESVKVTLSHVRCDPFTGKPVRGVIKYFHLVYARLLFAEGIREVLRQS